MARKKDAKKKRKQKERRSRKDKCPHCGSGPETFRFMYDIYNFDVDLARKIVGDGREPTLLDHDDVEYSVDISRIYPQHLDHVNPVYPGIIAHIWYPEPDGTILHGHVLIDGHHRAARCLRDEIPFQAHILSEDESRQVLLDAPDIDTILAELEEQRAAEASDEPVAVGC